MHAWLWREGEGCDGQCSLLNLYGNFASTLRDVDTWNSFCLRPYTYKHIYIYVYFIQTQLSAAHDFENFHTHNDIDHWVFRPLITISEHWERQFYIQIIIEFKPEYNTYNNDNNRETTRLKRRAQTSLYSILGQKQL